MVLMDPARCRNYLSFVARTMVCNDNSEEKSPLSSDNVCGEAAESNVRIKITEIDGDMIVIEGTREALLFLSALFAAQAGFSDDGFQLSPCGAGAALFAPESTKGLYIHRIEKEPREGIEARDAESHSGSD